MNFLVDILRKCLRRVKQHDVIIDMESPAVPILSGAWYTQAVRLGGAREVALRFATYGRSNDCSLDMVLHHEDGTVVGQQTLDGKVLLDNSLHAVRFKDGIEGDSGDIFLSVRSRDGRSGNNLGIWREKGIGARLVVRADRSLSLKKNPGIQSSLGGGFALGLQASVNELSYRRRWASLSLPASAKLLLLTGENESALFDRLQHLEDADIHCARINENWTRLNPDLVLIPSSVEDKSARAAALMAHRQGVPVVHIQEADTDTPKWRYFADLDIALSPSSDKRFLQEISARLSSLRQPTISIVLPLEGVRTWGQSVLASYAAQSYQGPIELVFVGQDKDGASVEWVEQRLAEEAPSHSRQHPLRSLFVLDAKAKHDQLWHLGAQAATGELLILSDRGIVVGENMLQAHIDAHSYNDCMLSIGSISEDTELPDARMDQAARLNRDHINCESFVNCRAGNIALRRTPELLRLISEAADSGLRPDWQSVAIGFSVYQQGGRIKFSTDALAYRHASMPADTPDDDLAELGKLCRQLAGFEATVRRWQEVYVEEQRARSRQITDTAAAAAKPRTAASSMIVSPTARPLKVITYRWHVPHQYELYKLPHQFDLMIGLGASISESWDLGQRPMPANARFITPEQFKESDYDLAILHFDENVLSHENTNGQLGEEWGANFRWFVENLKLPKVAICHGTPQFHGQYNPGYSGGDLMTVIEPARQRLVDYLADIEVVCNSHQAYREWGFKKSRVIWHGFDPTEFPPTQYTKGILSPLGPLVTSRPHYRGYFLYQQVFNETYPREFLPSQLSVADPHVDYAGNVFALAKFRNYVNELRKYSVYFNPTLRSPMPRARGEPMMCGVVTVNANNHDVDLFIKNGVNGFYSNDPDELREQLLYLMRNPDATRKIGVEARKTAMDVFNHDRYLSEWSSLINSVV